MFDLDVAYRVARLTHTRQREIDARAHPRVEALEEVMMRHAQYEAASRGRDAVDGRALHRLEQQAGVGHRAGQRPDVIERAAQRDDAIAGDLAERRLQA